MRPPWPSDAVPLAEADQAIQVLGSTIGGQGDRAVREVEGRRRSSVLPGWDSKASAIDRGR